MSKTDLTGLILTGASPAAAESYREAVAAYHRFDATALDLVEAALADSPGCIMAHVLRGHLTSIGSAPEFVAMARASHEAAKDQSGTDREKRHVAALGALLDGRLYRAGRILEDLSIELPRDGVALQAGQMIDFLVGDSRMLRDRITRAAPAWSSSQEDYHALLGMMAFGLEEAGDYARAEACGRRAVELEPRNGWAQHAVAHVLEMQDRRGEGIVFMRADSDSWSTAGLIAVHNWWHLALYHLGLGQIDEVLALYDGPIYGAKSPMGFDMVDAAAMLWRLHLRGVDVGQRWADLADVYEAKGAYGAYAFEDAHAVMAFVGAGRTEAVAAVLDIQRRALGETDDNAFFVQAVGLPLMEGLAAFGAGDYATTADRLRSVRNHAARFGGSHAQRDLIDLTLIEAASRMGDRSLEQALLTERAAARPQAAGQLARAA